MKQLLASLGTCLCLSVSYAQTDTAQTHYNLFKPVPKSQMREMATDRPDVTENAYTLDAGHFQVETDLLKTVQNKGNGIRYVQDLYNLANIKLGLTNTSDFQVVVNSYQESRTAPKTTTSGIAFSEVALRIKQNLWGNNSGKTALSVMPYVNIPLKGDDKRVDGGVILPFAAELKNNWGFGAQAQFDMVKNESKGYHAEILNSVTFNHSIMKNLEGFVESFYNYSFQDKDFQAYADGGLIFSVSDNVKLDAGLNYGITKGADKVYFLGLSFRY